MKLRLRPSSRRRGVAILTVLAIVTLSTVIVVSLLQTGINARQISAGQAGIQSAERYADTAIQMAIAQLKTGTAPRESEDGGTTPAPWTSQPGAVTRHHMDGSIDRIYKLYSADEPVARTMEQIAEDLPVDWNRMPGQYVDLNQPFIGDGGALTFPVADPRVAGPEGAEGFEVETFRAPNGTRFDSREKPGDRRLPMPVRWIYLLKDGTAGVLDNGGQFRSRRGGSSAANPIVARIAWWADDETSKINVNTAGEASPWDTPRLTTRQDEALARNQPMKGEYHRYPGHPAGVSLSSVLFPGQRWLQPGDRQPANSSPMSLSTAEGLWELAAGSVTDPEMTSLGGTRRPPGLEIPGGNGVTEDWHLYTSPAELLYAHNRERRSLFEKDSEAATRLMRSGFLLTARSQAPETTLFGTPRLSLWPVHESVQPGIGFSSPVERASTVDTLLALCATANDRKYYVQRATPGDGANDFQRTGLGSNSQLFGWLTRLMERPVPGFQIPVTEGTTAAPNTFAEKYGAGTDGDSQNLAALMMDYIRTTNLADGAIPKENQFSIVCPGNETEGYGQISPLDTARGTSGKARWNSTQLTAPRGLGRMPTIRGAILLVTCRAWVNSEGQVVGSPSKNGLKHLTKRGARELEAAILFEGFVPGQGWAESRPYCTLVVSGITPGDPPNFSKTMPALQMNGGTFTKADTGSMRVLKDAIVKRNSLVGGSTASGGSSMALLANTLIFAPVVVQPSVEFSEYLEFNGTNDGNTSNGFKVGVFDDPNVDPDRPASSLGDLVQVVELNFPAFPLHHVPLPELPTDGTPYTLEERLASAFEKGTRLLSAQDVAQSLVPAHGDSRLLAGQRVVPADSFVAHPSYGARALAHRLPGEPGSSSAAAPMTAGYFEDLLQPAGTAPEFPIKPWDTRNQVVRPDFPGRGITAQTMAQAFTHGRRDNGHRGPATPAETGDFDTASGRTPDGPYVNRADDGEVRGYASGGVPYFDPPPSDPKIVPPVSAAASSPNRLVPGPGMFGSLPTGVKANVPWQTLLFRPWLEKVTPSRPAHYGATWPPDHLLMDLFWMPVVEPYGISTPLQTAGKINLNHQILPFRHVHRATALHALLKSERIIAVADRDAAEVKRSDGFSDAVTRHGIEATTTLAAWDRQRDANARPWISASEVCTLPLFPSDQEFINQDIAPLRDWWAKHRLTGDNLKERPYTNLQARLTTRSNTFRIHIIAQSLQKVPSSAPGRWDESRDQVIATWRSNALISRHIRLSDVPDYVSNPNAPSVDNFYSWGVTDQRRVPGQ